VTPGMRPSDLIQFALRAILGHRMRSGLTMLGITVGITAVILLTAIGTGIERYVLAEFTQFGTNLIGVTPGKTTTHGISGGVLGNVRPLLLSDAAALARTAGVEAIAPVVQGNALVETGGRERRTMVLGTGPAAPQVWQFPVAAGSFLPADDPDSPRAMAVLGSTLKSELFGTTSPLGAIVRIGGSRFRVVGVMGSKGQILGFDLDDAVYVPANRALELFNRESLMEIDVLYEAGVPAKVMGERIRAALLALHGEEDFTITTQEQMTDVLGDVLSKLTLAVGALGGISLLVGGVGILTIMTIAVRDRTAEIGLLRSLGSGRRQIFALFVGEAIVLSACGGAAGLLLGWLLAGVIHLLVPALPVQASWGYAALAEAISILIGLAAGVLPAMRAAGLDPVEALRAE